MIHRRSISFVAFVAVLITGIISCSEKKRHSDFQFNNPFLVKNDFSESLYFLGPQVDSSKTEIVAACDCCASDLAFLNDSVFVYVVRCFGGDSFLSGIYQPVQGGLILNYDDDYVRGYQSVTGFESNNEDLQFKMKYALETGNLTPEFVLFSKLNSMPVLTQKFDDGSTLYGMKDQNRTLNNFKDNLKSEGILKLLKL